MTTATAVLDVLRGYLGVAENPAHSNRTIIGVKFSKLPDADAGNGVAWCAETVTVAQHEAGNTAFQGSASCRTLVGRYQDGTNGTWLGNPGVDGILPGDEGFLGAGGGDHTFTVEYVDGNQVVCIDGNWGDKVTRVTRPISNVFGFGRPNYEPEPQPSGDNDMDDDEHNWLKSVKDGFDFAFGPQGAITNIGTQLAAFNNKLDAILTELQAKK